LICELKLFEGKDPDEAYEDYLKVELAEIENDKKQYVAVKCI
jgi:hypothetical protein